MGVRSNDEVFKSYSQCNDHMVSSKKDSFFGTENNKKILLKKLKTWLTKLNNDAMHKIL